jgi:DNA invertase Pin-like site-specific DNA recombinase
VTVQKQIVASPTRAARAAQYVRMSTEHQRYSTENQSETIRRYAETRGIEIVRTYADDGKTGLNLEGRKGLRALLRDIEAGQNDFSSVLVYDVSRWGRFQDADESAYYEFVCRRANVSVHYCAEQFENDGSMSTAVLKTVKRVMAGEYSRELSVKVFQGQGHLIELGFRQGGARIVRPRSSSHVAKERACRPIESFWYLGPRPRLRLSERFTISSLEKTRRNSRLRIYSTTAEFGQTWPENGRAQPSNRF